MTPGPGSGGPGRRAALLLLFLLSGAAALVYEVSWTRRLVLLVGSTSGATALLLSAYMLGLAIGARLGGPVADRSRRPLRLYALLECGAAAFALLLPHLLDGLSSLRLLTAAGREPLLFGAAFLALLLPTTLLGATLPALARAVTEDPAAAGRRVGALYAANTLGAVAGALGAGFVLVEALGVDGAGRAAVALSLLVAAGAWLLGDRDAGEGAAGAGAGEEPAPEPAPGVLRAATAAAFAGGFVGLAAEVLWTRQLVFLLQGFTATFAAMLGAFLLGSALGGAFFSRVAGRTERPLALLGWLQVGVAVAAAGALALLREQYGVVQWLRGATDPFDSPRADHFALLLSAAFVVLGPPAFLMGGVFPAAVRAAAGGLGDLGARVGRIYAANTLGAVLGSLAAGFAGVPLLGTGWSAAAAALLSLLAGAATLLAARRLEPSPRAGRRIPLLAAAGVAVVLLAALGRPGEPMILRSGVFLGPRGRENELLEAREGRAGLASVVRNVRNGYTSLYTDEFLAASTEGRYRYMRMLGHIPVVLAEDPRRVLVMAFGTGTTAGSLSTHPSVERLDVVEISPEVLEVADRFESVNRGVVARAGKEGRPEVRLHVDDARRFVLASGDTWDVITLEPLLPYTPGAVHLYTREFYALCRERLSPGGALCQWFPVHSMSRDDFRMLVASFIDVFPETSLWFVEETAALVGTAGPQGLPVGRSADRLAAAGPREDLEAGRLDDLAQWWSFRLCGGRALREWVDRPPAARAMTDEHPSIEFRPVPTGAITTFLHDNLVEALDLRERERVEDLVDLSGIEPREAAAFRARLSAAAAATEAYLDGRASEDLFGFHASHTRLAATEGARAEHERAAGEALRTAARRYADAIRANPRDRIVADRWRNVEAVRLLNEGRALLSGGKAGEAAESYLGAIEADAPWNRDEAWTGLARARLREGKAAAGREAAEKALSLYPGSRDAQALLGQALVALGRPGEARRWFERAFEGGSGPSDEDTAMRNARDLALASEPAEERAAGDAEIAAALREALDDASGPGERRRQNA
ncbi:MAG: fused MFS/spermidine synthase, partial [Planctomycetes bacterium]|nr:fused MFS/spermidine synthase [Planctomycetota bacterium]